MPLAVPLAPSSLLLYQMDLMYSPDAIMLARSLQTFTVIIFSSPQPFLTKTNYFSSCIVCVVSFDAEIRS